MPKPVNVASVPQRSSFRYPGGKTWFVPTFRQWLAHIHPKPRVLVEPFAGGAIISLTALFENLVEKSVMVELDDEIAAVWESIINGDAEWLANRVITFDLTSYTNADKVFNLKYLRKENVIKELCNCQVTPSLTRLGDTNLYELSLQKGSLSSYVPLQEYLLFQSSLRSLLRDSLPQGRAASFLSSVYRCMFHLPSSYGSFSAHIDLLW